MSQAISELFLSSPGILADHHPSAGVTDSALTNHGVLQAHRLGAHLVAINLKTACIFSSDLQRAFKTADAIRTAQDPIPQPVLQLPLLREQDFGFYEGKRFYERPKDSVKNGRELHTDTHKTTPGFVDVESKESMGIRASAFVDLHLLDHLDETPGHQAVVVVAHGIILTHLWRSILRRFDPKKVTMSAGVEGADRGLEYLGGWSNTGYLDLEITSSKTKSVLNAPIDVAKKDGHHPDAIFTPADILTAPVAKPADSTPLPQDDSKFSNMSLVIKAVNSLEHLKGLKKTRGGIGSLKHDSTQKTMDSFFKKRKHE